LFSIGKSTLRQSLIGIDFLRHLILLIIVLLVNSRSPELAVVDADNYRDDAV